MIKLPDNINDDNVIEYIDKYIDGRSIANIYICNIIEEAIGKEVILEEISVSSINKILDDFYKENTYTTYEQDEKIIRLLQRLNYISSNLVKNNIITYDIEYLINNPDYIKKYKKEINSIDKTDVLNAYEKISKINDKYIDILRKNKNKLVLLVDSGTRGNKYALTNSLLSNGYKINNKSEIIPEYINQSYIEGITEPNDVYKLAVSARNAILINANNVSDSGYIERKLNLLTKEIYYSKEDDCNTNRTVKVKITDKNYKLFNSRYIKENNKIICIDKEHLKQYIGKTVDMFSPVVCQSSDNGICKKCYGENIKYLYKYDKIGLMSSSIFSNFVTQALLSSKHLQFIRLPKKPDCIKYIDGKYIISIDAYIEYKAKDEEFIIKPKDSNEQEFSFSIPFSIENDFSINASKGDVIIDVSNKSVKNKDTKSLLKLIKSVLEKTGDFKDINDINTYLEIMHNLSMKVNPNLQLIHIELILSTMIRTKDYKLYRNNNSKKPIIMGITKVLKNIHNIVDLLAFERISQTLSRFDLLYSDTEYSSIEDLLFK